MNQSPPIFKEAPLPTSVKLLDIVYTIAYVDNASEVDIHRRQSLHGQVDPWTRTIRIYKADRATRDILQTLWHEVFHAVADKLKIQCDEGNLYHQETPIDLLATAINAILQDNPELVALYAR